MSNIIDRQEFYQQLDTILSEYIPNPKDLEEVCDQIGDALHEQGIQIEDLGLHSELEADIDDESDENEDEIDVEDERYNTDTED